MDKAPDPAEELVDPNPEALRDLALRRIRKRRDFRAHLFVYVVINAVIWAVWSLIALNSGSWYPWPLWVSAGWGVGLVFHVWDAYFRQPITEDEVRREMDRLAHLT